VGGPGVVEKEWQEEPPFFPEIAVSFKIGIPMMIDGRFSTSSTILTPRHIF
jgi:hypothetical protein